MQLEVVKDYYGKLLKSSKDLKTSACCDGAALPPHLQALLANVHPRLPPSITAAGSSCRRSGPVLDLGSGSGTYKGSVREQPDAFELDGHHFIEHGKVFPVCGNTWRMLADTRFSPHFGFIGDFSTHYGIFPGCGTSIPFAAGGPQEARGSCC